MTTVVFHKVVKINTGAERERIKHREFAKERKAFSHLLDLIEAGKIPEAVEFRTSWQNDPKKKQWGEYLATEIHELLWSAAVFGDEMIHVKTERSKPSRSKSGKPRRRNESSRQRSSSRG